jgi:hypothetical protein
MLYLVIAIVLLFFLFEKRKISDEVDISEFFYISNGISKDTYVLMHKDGMTKEELDKFVYMEDRFLQYEKDSVCLGITQIVPATVLSNKIKEAFPKYNFSYHTIHLKQIAEPKKSINLKIKCP